MSHKSVSAYAEEISLVRLFLIFFKIGCISWGGYMALISVVRSEIVGKYRLIEDDDIMDGVALAMLLPGPVAVNVVAYVGDKIRGPLGGAVCAAAVILPSFLLMVGFAALYLSWGTLVVADKALAGVLPAIAAIILNAGLKMREKALQGPIDVAIAAIAAVLLLTVGGIWVVVGIFAVAAVVGILRHQSADADIPVEEPRVQPAFGRGSRVVSLFLLMCIGLFLFLPQLNITSILVQLFSVFSGMSLLLFGGGYIFIPMIQEAVVNTYGWLAIEDFAASIALGQVTPGPILISATFIGYKVAGLAGAVIATIAIFMPPAALIILASHQLQRFRHLSRFKAAQAGIRTAVFGLIISAAASLLIGIASEATNLLAPAAIFVLSCVLLMHLKKGEIWTVLIAAGLGLLIF
ncbi:chromate efflux transporter [Aliiroseovarius sp. S253]|uniref:chromate efflux transporter n=1 Tax=Aliiroseovarius sp. S253 TaxID=3415133 RepID=UPI003C7BDB26